MTDFRPSLPWRLASQLVRADAPYPPFVLLQGDCFLWDGKWDTGNGYGKVSWEGRHRVVHRVVYELLEGEVPRHLLLDHRCLRRRCCQPLHLQPVTVRENTLRGRAVLFKPLQDGSIRTGSTVGAA